MEGFLTTGYCFPYCFLKILVGGQGLDGEGQSRDGVFPQSPPPPLGKTLKGASFVLGVNLGESEGAQILPVFFIVHPSSC